MKLRRFAFALLLGGTFVSAAQAESSINGLRTRLSFRLAKSAQLVDTPVPPVPVAEEQPAATVPANEEPLLPPVPMIGEQPDLPAPRIEATILPEAPPKVDESPSDLPRASEESAPVEDLPARRAEPAAETDDQSALEAPAPSVNQFVQGGYGYGYAGPGCQGCGGYSHYGHSHYGYFTPGCCDRPRSPYYHIWDGYCEENCFGFRADDCEMRSWNGPGCNEGACLDNTSCESCEACDCQHQSSFNWRGWLTAGKNYLCKAFVRKHRRHKACHAPHAPCQSSCCDGGNDLELPVAPEVEAPRTLDSEAI